eukprot:TRINITY_DN29124_c0_g1_i1.p1 TRINITY_DN29124_c0_g1~~TRINITY_DN29124_c0_g1_i1.p1  ORF type:complete len:214 (+),score=28.57 TRINITY_DN29124_c0_g1_i1:81-722(+)
MTSPQRHIPSSPLSPSPSSPPQNKKFGSPALSRSDSMTELDGELRDPVTPTRPANLRRRASLGHSGAAAIQAHLASNKSSPSSSPVIPETPTISDAEIKSLNIAKKAVEELVANWASSFLNKVQVVKSVTRDKLFIHTFTVVFSKLTQETPVAPLTAEFEVVAEVLNDKVELHYFIDKVRRESSQAFSEAWIMKQLDAKDHCQSLLKKLEIKC